jgi:hypothetical protein
MVPFRPHLAGIAILALNFSALGPTNIAPWLEAQAELKNWTPDFVQTRTLKLLKHHCISFAPNVFRWELRNPTQTVAIRTSNLLEVGVTSIQRSGANA